MKTELQYEIQITGKFEVDTFDYGTLGSVEVNEMIDIERKDFFEDPILWIDKIAENSKIEFKLEEFKNTNNTLK